MFCFLGPEACEILAPWPAALEGKVLTTGMPGKSPKQMISILFMQINYLWWKEQLTLHFYRQNNAPCKMSMS